MNKTLLRATAVLVCFAFLMLLFPGTIMAESKRFNFIERFEKPFAFIAELLSYLPVFSLPTVPPSSNPVIEDGGKTTGIVKTTGDLNRGRPSDED